jgi:hypothetical protein
MRNGFANWRAVLMISFVFISFQWLITGNFLVVSGFAREISLTGNPISEM